MLWRPLTKTEKHGNDLAPDTAKHNVPGIVNGIDGAVVELEDAHHPAGPCGDAGNGEEEEHAGYHANGVKDLGHRQDAKANLRLDHDDNGALPAEL